MTQVTRLILDVLKPHSPSVIELARAIAARATGYRVSVRVQEMDEKTESVTVVVEGVDVSLEEVAAAVSEMGASVHSIDGVEVRSDGAMPD